MQHAVDSVSAPVGCQLGKPLPSLARPLVVDAQRGSTLGIDRRILTRFIRFGKDSSRTATVNITTSST